MISTAAQITAAITKAFSKKLSLIGGTMTGALTIDNTLTTTGALTAPTINATDLTCKNVAKFAGSYVPLTVDGFSAGSDGALTLTNNAYLDSAYFVGSEKVYTAPDTSYTSIVLANGHIQYITGTECTLPSAPTLYVTTLTILTPSTTMTWGGTIYWPQGVTPTLLSGVNIINFLGYNGVWYGAYAGSFKKAS